jgi:hypothetical protein
MVTLTAPAVLPSEPEILGAATPNIPDDSFLCSELPCQCSHSRQGGFYGFSLGGRSRERACRAAQSFSRSERHCMHGIGIVVCHQNSEAVRASDQSEDYEGKNEAELAAKVRGTKIPKFGMQSARKEHSNSPLYPCP